MRATRPALFLLAMSLMFGSFAAYSQKQYEIMAILCMAFGFATARVDEKDNSK